MNTIWFPDLSNTRGAKYIVLSDAIRAAVANGQIAPGEQMLPVRELGWQLQVTPGTVARAYTKLTEEGLLEAAVGRGTFVAQNGIAAKKLPPIPPLSQTIPKPEVIELLSPLLPDVGQEQLIRACYQRMAQVPNGSLIEYPSQKTEIKARRAIFNWLSGTEIGRFDPEDIVLAHGGQNAIMLVLQTLLKDPNPVILTEDLTYAGFRHAARLLRAEIIGLKCDNNGIIPNSYEAALKQYGPQVLCTSPEVHNPSTGHTNLARRREIAAIAERYNAPILEDDCYHMQGSGLPNYRALVPELGYYISSLSKSLTPSLRVGFVVAPKDKIAKVRRAAQFNHFGLAITITDLTELVLNSPELDEIRRAVRDRVNDYVHIAVNALGRYDLRWRKDVPFLWLKLPRGWRASHFLRAAERRGVRLRSADDFALLDGRAPHSVRITVNGQISCAHFAEAMQVLEQLLNSPPDSIEV